MENSKFENWRDGVSSDSHESVVIGRAIEEIVETNDIEAIANSLEVIMAAAFKAGMVAALKVEIVEDYELLSVPEMATELKRLKDELTVFDAIKKEYQKAYDFLSISILPDRMDEENISTMKIEGTGRLQVASDIRCSVPAANRPAMQRWLIDNGHESMISPSINASTLKAFVKERMREDKEYPEDLLTISAYSRATVVKG